ncbi:CRP-like cAMP-binding protein [Keratinibaculum paraultunense]|uniref:CRP-like cAMP-binding protein n=1 Tax=Keratinibaculum paraultunense TaxID=1278232 RepID=A0A4R3KWJ5_9FIRM|nr:Crp/Fnr family transcriptional regulator [Keratinibaculum paraultunense]QQY79295.1 Crp/Fnr family transcriptional regulator [Keratinibaculum paraultunense]TCS89428.1 CRP-like cAMP-binding protein [Keratinibaculum paraultunense]
MYDKYFETKRQEKMRKSFLEIGEKGAIRKYPKNSLIKIEGEDVICIVMSGNIKQSIYSIEGEEKTLYLLQSGEIFKEMDYFCGGESKFLTKALVDSTISILHKEVVEQILFENPNIYRDIIHSITRKFRIVMFQMANMTFSDSVGKVADTLIRLYYQEGEEIAQGKKINDKFTHEEIAKLIGCSRVTVTRALNKFRDENIIDIVNGEIIIKDIEKLEKYIRWK